MKSLFPILFLFILLIGCAQKDPVTPVQTLPSNSAKGVYVLNEGNFGEATGARLSFYDIVQKKASFDVFETANQNSHLGSVGDDMKLFDGKLYIVLSGSEELKVIDASTFILLGSKNLFGHSPHDVIIDSARNNIIITRLYRQSIIVLDRTSLQIKDSISVGTNPIGLLIDGNYLYVSNSGYGSDNRVSVIDLRTLTVERTIIVGDGPSGMTKADDGNIYIACTGNEYGTPMTFGSLHVLSASSRSLIDSNYFQKTLTGTIASASGGQVLFGVSSPGSYYGGGIAKMHRTGTGTFDLSMDFISGNYYSIAIDGESSEIYCSDVRSFSSDGEIVVHGLADGVKKFSFPAQKGPGSILFKR